MRQCTLNNVRSQNSASKIPRSFRHILTVQQATSLLKTEEEEEEDDDQSINQSMAVTDAGTKVPVYPYHTFYTLLVFKST